MPFATKTGDLAMPLSWWTSYIWKDVFFSVEISTCWLLQQVPEGSFFEEVFRRLGLCSLPLPHDFTIFFFPKRLSFVASKKPGAWQSISPAEPCFMVGHPQRAGCGQGLQRRAAGRRGRRLGTRGRVPGPPLPAALS